ncbi:bifunctional diguanylate cyclase/phosphodiesterase [Colwellia sp. MEBiC06753]
MSLSKQLYLGLVLVLTIVFTVTLWINITNTKNFISQQLSVHAQDAATSLGHTIQADSESANDPELYQAIAEVRMNVIFDSGYYQDITLVDHNSNVIYRLTNTSQNDAIPTWFINLFPIDAPSGTTEFLINWQHPRTLSLTTHPGHAYKQLWQSSKDILWMIIGLFIFAGSLVFILLKAITTPIQRAANQADQICQGNFVLVDKLPKPKELNLFVNAMNRMSSTLKNMFHELTQQTEKYRQFAFVDELTQIPNRRAFNNQLDSVFASQEKAVSGLVYIIRLTGLNDVNKSLGYSAGDEYVLQAAEIICRHISTNDKLYRIGGADFAVISEGQPLQEGQYVIEQLVTDFSKAPTRNNLSHFAHIGVTTLTPNKDQRQVMAEADDALSQAQLSNKAWAFAREVSIPQETMDWKEHLEELLNKDAIKLVAQPIKNVESQIQYYEIFARLDDAGKEVSMSQLMLVADKYGLTSVFDKQVVAKCLDILSSNPLNIAINVSNASLCDQSFTSWLLNVLAQVKPLCPYITFEISEHCIANQVEATVSLVNQLKNLGCKVTLEHFGSTTASFTHLTQLKPDFVKIDGSYCQQIIESKENQLFIQSLVNIAHNLNIQVIAELIEDAQQLAELSALFVDYFQGYYIGKPNNIGGKTK